MGRIMRLALGLCIVGVLGQGCLLTRLQPRKSTPAAPGTGAVRHTVDLGKIGIEVYPGAKLRDGRTADQAGSSSMMALLHTPDEFSKVADFYRGRYPAPLTMSQTGGNKTPGVLAMVLSSFPHSRNVTVSEDLAGGGTQITLRCVTRPSPQGKPGSSRQGP